MSEPRSKPLSSNVIGLFPSGGIGDIVAANYTSPHDVAQAYLDDRTRPDQLPTGYGARAGVTGALGELIADIADDIADAAIRIDAASRPRRWSDRWSVAGCPPCSVGLTSTRPLVENAEAAGYALPAEVVDAWRTLEAVKGLYAMNAGAVEWGSRRDRGPPRESEASPFCG